MNIDNINKTIEVMRNDKRYGFDMGYFVGEQFDEKDNVCGTTCCLAGFAYVAQNGSVTAYDGTNIDYREIAEDYFGIDSATGFELFIPTNKGINQNDIDIGIKALERLRDTGEVLWLDEEYQD